MMLVDRITFTGHGSMITVKLAEDGRRFEVEVDMAQRLYLTLEQFRALTSALTRVLEGR